MPLTAGEVEDLLTVLASLDPLHTVNSQDKMSKKVRAWSMVLSDCSYEPAMLALRTYYQDPNAKTITPAILRMMAIRATPRPVVADATPQDAAARQRACNARTCTCPHTECWNGFLDAETVIVNQYGQYPAVRRCPTCHSAQTSEFGGEK